MNGSAFHLPEADLSIAPVTTRVLTTLFAGQPVPRVGASNHRPFAAGKDACIAAILEALRAEQTEDDGLLTHFGAREMEALGNIIVQTDTLISGLMGLDVHGQPPG